LETVKSETLRPSGGDARSPWEVMKQNQPAIQLENVAKVFNIGRAAHSGASGAARKRRVVPVRALDGVNLRVTEGELLAISGPSGSGKSTLLHIIGCLLKPTSGRYLFTGRPVETLNEFQLAVLRNRNFGFVFQAFNLLPRLSALENVQLPLIYDSISPRQRRERARQALEQVGVSHRSHHRPGELSGGEQQRVAIARALVTNPSVILADEPTGNLDSESGASVLRTLIELNRTGKTVIIVTHEQTIVEKMPRMVKLRDGLVVK
jgi:putative ABC transport system ATP-binding protein